MMLFIEIIIMTNQQTLIVKNLTKKKRMNFTTKENKFKDKIYINQKIRLNFRIFSD